MKWKFKQCKNTKALLAIHYNEKINKYWALELNIIYNSGTTYNMNNKIKQQHSRGFSILYNHTIGNNNKEKKYFWNIYKYTYKSEKQNGTSMSISKLIWWHVGQKYHTLFLHTVLVSVQRNLLQNQYKSDLCQFHLTRSTSTSLGMN